MISRELLGSIHEACRSCRWETRFSGPAQACALLESATNRAATRLAAKGSMKSKSVRLRELRLSYNSANSMSISLSGGG